MTEYDFSDLTGDQQRLLTFQGWKVGDRLRQPTPQTARELIERGLVIPHDRTYCGVVFKEYEVPIAVHMAWCEHCETLEREQGDD